MFEHVKIKIVTALATGYLLGEVLGEVLGIVLRFDLGKVQDVTLYGAVVRFSPAWFLHDYSPLIGCPPWSLNCPGGATPWGGPIGRRITSRHTLEGGKTGRLTREVRIL